MINRKADTFVLESPVQWAYKNCIHLNLITNWTECTSLHTGIMSRLSYVTWCRLISKRLFRKHQGSFPQRNAKCTRPPFLCHLIQI